MRAMGECKSGCGTWPLELKDLSSMRILYVLIHPEQSNGRPALVIMGKKNNFQIGLT